MDNKRVILKSINTITKFMLACKRLDSDNYKNASDKLYIEIKKYLSK